MTSLQGGTPPHSPGIDDIFITLIPHCALQIVVYGARLGDFLSLGFGFVLQIGSLQGGRGIDFTGKMNELPGCITQPPSQMEKGPISKVYC